MVGSKIVRADSSKYLKKLKSNSVDLLCTDPPYGLSFMGKDWDKSIPSKKIWKQSLRVLKPGAFAFIMCIPRQDCLSRMIIALEESGFVVNFSSIYWTYSSGFPKAQNISKAIDKKLGKKRKVVRIDEKRVAKFGRSANRTVEHPGGWKECKRDVNITEPASEKAKELNGSYAGCQLKPAVEIIIVAMKPLSEKTYVEQAMKNGKGVVWSDNCRIPYKDNSDKSSAIPQGKITTKDSKSGVGAAVGGKNNYELNKKKWQEEKQIGRFPANLLVSDDVLNDGRNISYGNSKLPYNYTGNKYKVEGFIKDNSPSSPSNFGDNGSYSRYFDLDLWFERKKLPERLQKVFPFLIEKKAAKSEKNKGLNNFPKKQMYKKDNSFNSLEILGTTAGGRLPRKNYHPTVKPIKLMSYLITLGSRKKDLILDPFMGSGTTCIAAKLLKRKFIGVELNKEYYEIAKARIKNSEE